MGSRSSPVSNVLSGLHPVLRSSHRHHRSANGPGTWSEHGFAAWLFPWSEELACLYPTLQEELRSSEADDINRHAFNWLSDILKQSHCRRRYVKVAAQRRCFVSCCITTPLMDARTVHAHVRTELHGRLYTGCH